MTKALSFLIFLSLFFFINQAYATSLQIGEIYRVTTNISVCVDMPTSDTLDGCKNVVKVGRFSRYRVLNIHNNFYVIDFTQIYDVLVYNTSYVPPAEGEPYDPNAAYKYEPAKVTEGELYYLPLKYNNAIIADSLAERSINGATSGPLIVPFKFRLDDKSLSGEATLGYYVGFDVSSEIGEYWCTPLISAGLTQISVSSSDGQGGVVDDTKTGVTIALGLLLKNWDGMNVGFVVGQDRIGDQSWAHEGETWISFSVGWQIQ